MKVDTDEDKKTLNVETTTMNLENAEKPVNNDAKICDSAVRDIFHIFANMLDAKSFLKLAMTCKGMYKQCMEDKTIKINVVERYISVYCNDGRAGFSLRSSSISGKNLRSYVATLRKHRFNLTVNTVNFNGVPNADIPIVNSTHNFLKEIGVKRIKKITIYNDSSSWNEITSLIQEFGVNILFARNSPMPLPILRSLLQLDLDEIDYGGRITVEELMEIDFPIRTVKLRGIRSIEWDQFMQILWKIQTGSLQRLTVRSVNWTNDEPLKYDVEDELPEDRPLIFRRKISENREERFILHWQGGVTKCVISDDIAGFPSVEISVCPSNELPPILRKDEDILKDLIEMVPKVSCYKRQFDAFMDNFTLIEPSYEGPLPTERPLYFKTENGFLKLTEDAELMVCKWNDTQATWKPFGFVIPEFHLKPVMSSPFGYRALRKLMFIKRLQKPIPSHFYFDCEGVEEFDFLLEDYEKVDLEHSGGLPKERQFLFETSFHPEGGEKRCCVILFEDRLLQCRLFNNRIFVERSDLCYRPRILSDAQYLMKILQRAYRLKQRSIRMDHETFLKGFELFKTSPSRSYSRLPLAFEKTQNIDGKLVEERWFDNDHHGLYKTFWQDGHATIKPTREVPLEFTKELFKKCAEAAYFGVPLPMDLEQFESCLEQFEMHPFDYCGPLLKDRILAVVKKEILHICNDQPAHCGCSEVSYRVWFLSDGVKVCHCTWKANKVQFMGCHGALPPILKSRRYLKNLLEKKSIEHECWYGSLADFDAHFDDYIRISSSYKGPLPKERPLVVERDHDGECIRYLLRDDGSIIECRWLDHVCVALLETARPFVDRIPAVLMSSFVTY